MSENNQFIAYECRYVIYGDKAWDDLPENSLVDVVTGGEVREPTKVKACWDERALYVRFDCTDNHCVSDFKNRKDPLYEQDVVEVFIDEEGLGNKYMEIVLSPNNVVYDVFITHKPRADRNQPVFDIDREWTVEGLETSVEVGELKRTYTLSIPFSNFGKAPREDVEWKINFFRIDDDPEGNRHFQAWSPSGRIQFHLSEFFGTLRFVKV
ncbi:carbohydrate-binding family 9-like protein [Cohnella endophytica]|uniref:carbohydrate-binding family 9-like protein n=1 Tax=Cohnella endophytica TaxID=2419778 RepID=UPI00131405D1|nr:carbohydrate-binding family 9-like protein [Cohnella endophytica]